ncbi:hypothetical protein LJB99_05175 [Deltaproteobacteria bacterium OttesenSCG-928-K17]|nr:hypothetical protein [Deltaproteobacteria bacterium OttesenSCG-928-K17]
MLMLMTALLIWGGPGMAEVASDAYAGAKSAPCKGLKPFNNLDELLYQVYINFDSDCLFKMPVEDLEKAWGTGIYSFERDGLSRAKNRPYESEKYGFYIEAPASTYMPMKFQINITDDYYGKHHTLFPDGKYPSLLPQPISYKDVATIFMNQEDSHQPQPAIIGEYKDMPYRRYYWVNADKTQMLQLHGFNYSVTAITLWLYSEPPLFLMPH